MFAREGQQFLRVFFGDRRRELAGVNEFELRRLLRHGGGNFLHAMSDEVYGSRSGEIEILISVAVPHVDAFAANGGRKVLPKRTAKNSGAGLKKNRRGHA